MTRKAAQITIDARLCKGCHICISVCPHDVLRKSDIVDDRGYYLPVVANPEACTLCHLCEMECPDFAISVEEKKD